MTPKERFLATMRHEPTDRVVTVYKGTEEVDEQLMKHFSVSNMDELLEAMGADYVHWPYFPLYPQGFLDLKEEAEGVFCNNWGVRKKWATYDLGKYLETVEHPLANIESVSELEDYPWPEPADYDYSVVTDQAEKYGDRLALGGGHCVFLERCNELMGMEKTLTELLLNPQLMEALIEKLFNIEMDYNRRIFKAAKGKIDIFDSGDDLGSQTAPIMNPDTWRHFFKPYVKKMYDFAHQNKAYTKTHCDGQVTVFLPDFIEIGLNLFDPLMPLITAMDPYKLIPQYHTQLVFNGTIDTQGFLQNATVVQVKDEVQKQLSTFEPYGGFVLCPSHMIQPGTPLENIIAIYDAVKVYYSC